MHQRFKFEDKHIRNETTYSYKYFLLSKYFSFIYKLGTLLVAVHLNMHYLLQLGKERYILTFE